jgi:hypothetical protein
MSDTRSLPGDARDAVHRLGEAVEALTADRRVEGRSQRHEPRQRRETMPIILNKNGAAALDALRQERRKLSHEELLQEQELSIRIEQGFRRLIREMRSLRMRLLRMR